MCDNISLIKKTKLLFQPPGKILSKIYYYYDFFCNFKTIGYNNNNNNEEVI